MRLRFSRKLCLKTGEKNVQDSKTLNHNSFIGVEEENNREYLVMGKGIAFGKKRDSVCSRETMPAFIP